MILRSWLVRHSRRTQIRYIMLATSGVLAVCALVIYCAHVALVRYFDPVRQNPPDRVVVLTTSWCPICKSLKSSLARAKIEYVEIDVEKDWKGSYAYYATNSPGVPVVIVGSNKISGSMAKKLAAIKAACDRTNFHGKYNCGRLDDEIRKWSGVRQSESPLINWTSPGQVKKF